MPKRIQRRRTKGWRAPAGAKYVGRGTRWGNPWVIVRTGTGTGWAVNWAGASPVPNGLRDSIPAGDQHDAHALAVELYRTWLLSNRSLMSRLPELAGRDLMCWCSESMPCHVDTLLELSNRKEAAA